MTIFGPNGEELHAAQSAPLYIIERTGWHWSSDDGFVYDKCEHRAHGACLRCRFGWLRSLWRHGNRIWYLP